MNNAQTKKPFEEELYAQIPATLTDALCYTRDLGRLDTGRAASGDPSSDVSHFVGTYGEREAQIMNDMVNQSSGGQAVAPVGPEINSHTLRPTSLASSHGKSESERRQILWDGFRAASEAAVTFDQATRRVSMDLSVKYYDRYYGDHLSDPEVDELFQQAAAFGEKCRRRIMPPYGLANSLRAYANTWQPPSRMTPEQIGMQSGTGTTRLVTAYAKPSINSNMIRAVAMFSKEPSGRFVREMTVSDRPQDVLQRAFIQLYPRIPDPQKSMDEETKSYGTDISIPEESIGEGAETYNAEPVEPVFIIHGGLTSGVPETLGPQQLSVNSMASRSDRSGNYEEASDTMVTGNAALQPTAFLGISPSSENSRREEEGSRVEGHASVAAGRSSKGTEAPRTVDGFRAKTTLDQLGLWEAFTAPALFAFEIKRSEQDIDSSLHSEHLGIRNKGHEISMLPNDDDLQELLTPGEHSAQWGAQTISRESRSNQEPSSSTSNGATSKTDNSSYQPKTGEVTVRWEDLLDDQASIDAARQPITRSIQFSVDRGLLHPGSQVLSTV
ncbi:hypothetical protein IAT40_006707 [Kwoniella sp. CBS 6097]